MDFVSGGYDDQFTKYTPLNASTGIFINRLILRNVMNYNLTDQNEAANKYI